MMNVNRWIITCTIIFFAAACNIFNSDNPDNPDNWPEWDAHNTPPAELLEMNLVDVPGVVEQGQSVEFAMEVTNTSGQNYILIVGGFSKPGARDFLLTGEENKLYWHFAYPRTEIIDGRELKTAFPSIAVSFTLNAGESMIMRHEWEGKDLHGRTVEAGRYEVTGLYKVLDIWDEEGTTILYNEAGHYTTEPKAIVID
jgi:hypothetical protein